MKFKRILSVAMCAAMVLSSLATSVFAADLSFTAPTKPLAVDGNIITMATKAQAYVTPELLGINNLTSRGNEIPDGFCSVDVASKKAMLGVFGSDINENPNPYLYNYFYNCYAKENGLELADKYTLTVGSASGADTTIVEEYGTSLSLAFRPDILMVMQDGFTQQYVPLIADLPENKDSDPNNDYNPKLVNYPLTAVYDFLQSLSDLAAAADEVSKETGKTCRYGDPVIVAENIEKYVKGLLLYVLEELDKNGAEKKVVAVIDPVNSENGVFLASNLDTNLKSDVGARDRAPEFVYDTTINITDKLGKSIEKGTLGEAERSYYVLTAKEVLQADIIVTSGIQNSDGKGEEAFREDLLKYLDKSDTELIQKAQTIPIMSKRFNCVGSVSANAAENLLGMVYWTAFCYPEYINPIEAVAYWYRHFYHISDNNSLQSAVAANFKDASKPEGVTTDLSSFDEKKIEDKIVTGLKYYEKNKAALAKTELATNGGQSDTQWEINWTRGIGEGTDLTDPVSFTDVVPGSFYEKGVEWAVKKGVTNGTSDTTFSPDNTCNRGQMVTFLYRAAGSPAVTSTNNPFEDVKEGAFYYDSVLWAVENNITKGMDATHFGPDSNVSRGQAVTFMNRIENQKASSSANPFVDVKTGTYYYDSVLWAVEKGITNGMDDTHFAPDKTCSRAHIVTFLERYMG